jgi:hypothetical protein
MESKDVETINELIEKLRLGEVEGTIEITIKNKGKINKVLIKKDSEEGEIAEEIKRIKLNKPDLSDVDFSGTNIVESDLSGVNLSGANFSYSRIEDSNLSHTNLVGANLYKAVVSQSNLSYSKGLDSYKAYLTGSVSLYNVMPAGESPITNPYEGDVGEGGHYDEDEYAASPVDMSKVMPKKRRNY